MQPGQAPLMLPPGAQVPTAPAATTVAQPGAAQPGAAQPGAVRSGTDQAASAVTYQAPVFVDGSAPMAQPTQVQRSAQATESADVLFAQVQQLRQEVMTLRGTVEAQQYTIERMEREQRERYLDLDNRVARLTGSLASGGLATAPSSTGAADGAASALGGGAATGDERGAYERAFALTREKRFDEAAAAFRAFIDDYPSGGYVPNAWYWLGEIYLAQETPSLEDARQAFVQVVQLWPDHPKVPDALYKLGVVYDRLGEPSQARTYLERVRDTHPGSPAARLASRYLEDLAG
ncbi:MAG: tol-pal system protein YbgF [Pseudomonadales bacterium]|nr:tol-pal system protein YbgF [Pseudomonadales bacterium]